MGLTALIVEVSFRLQPVETPWMVVETEALRDLGAMLEGLEASALDWPYTVGWIDCLAHTGDVGRGILIRGRHARADEVGAHPPPVRHVLGVPIDAPEWLLNPRLMRLFNGLY